MQHVLLGALVAASDGVRDLAGGQPVVFADPHSVDGMWAAVGGDVTHLVLLGERRHEALVRRHAALVADRGIAVSWLVVPHGPAAVVALALQAGAYQLDAGLLPAYVASLAARTWSGAWTPTVARLEDPVPSLGQHLRSWLHTGAGFLVTLSPDPAVLTVGASARPHPAGYARPSLICAGAIPEPALRCALVQAGAGETVPFPVLNLDPHERFGSAKAVELLALPTDDAIRLPLATSLPRCVVCAAVVPGQFCTYCHVRPATASFEVQGAR